VKMPIYNVLKNYQVVKLDVYSPDLVNVSLMALFLAVILLTTVRTKKTSQLLCKEQTEQLKGVAIFFVVLGHLWVHVSQASASLVFSGDAVFLFLFLSGFGLTRSHQQTPYSLRSFVTKRIVRVFGPYWLATILIILLDYVILGKKYSIHSLIMTFVGINLSPELRHMDYARWFGTFISSF